MRIRLRRAASVLACVAGLQIAACTGDPVHPKQAPAIRTPQTGVIYLDRCSWEHDSARRVRTKSYSFVRYDDGTLLITVDAGPYDDSWIEKRAADFGIQLMDRVTTRRSHQEQRYEVENLQAIRSLARGARAQGRVSEKRDGVWIEYGFLAEVLESVSIDHRTLGPITTVPVRSTWLKDNLSPARITTVFFDAQTGDAIRYIFGTTPGRRDVCDRTKTDYQIKWPAGIKPPRLGVSYLAKCNRSQFSTRPSEEEITFQIIEGDTLRIEVVNGGRLSWVEKRLADHGIDVADRSRRYGEGPRKQVHHLRDLERVRKLIPGAHAEGTIHEYQEGNWFEYDVVVEVLDKAVISHTTLGDIHAIPVETRRTWASGGKIEWYRSYVDMSTGEIVRFESESMQGSIRSCDLVPQV